MDQQMDAVVFSELGRYEITTRPIPQIKNPQDVLVKILAASICGTDVHILHNPPGVIANPGIILGHECVAEIVSTGPAVKAFQPGDRVVADNNLPCGTCPACLSGHSNLCQSITSMGVHIDGVFCPVCCVSGHRPGQDQSRCCNRKSNFCGTTYLRHGCCEKAQSHAR